MYVRLPDELLSNLLCVRILGALLLHPLHAPIQEVELWEASAFGLIERVRDLLHTVNIDASSIVSVSAF